MRFPNMIFLVLASAALSTAQSLDDKKVPGPIDDPTFCDRAAKFCEIAFSWKDCSELYIASVKA